MIKQGLYDIEIQQNLKQGNKVMLDKIYCVYISTEQDDVIKSFFNDPYEDILRGDYGISIITYKYIKWNKIDVTKIFTTEVDEIDKYKNYPYYKNEVDEIRSIAKEAFYNKSKIQRYGNINVFLVNERGYKIILVPDSLDNDHVRGVLDKIIKDPVEYTTLLVNSGIGLIDDESSNTSSKPNELPPEPKQLPLLYIHSEEPKQNETVEEDIQENASWIGSIKNFISTKSRNFMDTIKKNLTWKNGMYAILGVGAIAALVAATWYGKKYYDRKKKLKELYGEIDTTIKNIKSLKASNPKSRYDISQVADICNGMGVLMYYTNSVLGVSEYINSVNLINFEKSIEDIKYLIDINSNESGILDAIVRTNIAFNPVNGEVINIIKDVEREVLTERITTKGTNSRLIISSLINGISGYVIYFNSGTIQADPFMILEKSSIKVATILENATANELLQVADAIRSIIVTDEVAKKSLDDIVNNYSSTYSNMVDILTVVFMPINDYYAIAPTNANYLTKVLNNYVNSI